MGNLISLVKQPVLEHLTLYVHSGCSSEMYSMEIQHCPHTCSLAVIVKVQDHVTGLHLCLKAD